jgi:BirA family biotin operon repressor/biotin-[acetyl-CoA-carboxylase] ligase
MISILAGVAIVRAVRTCTGSDPRIKWPNDVMLGGKKFGGILVESVVQGNQVAYAVLGIGINIGLDIETLADIREFTTSLNMAAGQPVSREDVLRQLLHNLDGLYQQVMQGEPVLPEWRSMLETLGQRVWARGNSASYTGLAEGVDELGNLQLRLDGGQMVTLTAGDVSLSKDG